MRIAILTYPMSNPDRLNAYAKALGDGLQVQGHSVDLFNVRNESNIRLGIYDYLCIGTQAKSFFGGKIDPVLGKRLEGMIGTSGKRSFAFVDKKLISSESVLRSLMKVMEAQGMFIRNSAVFSNSDTAHQVGETLEITRKA